MLLFRSRALVPCRDIIHVGTSISCRDINLSLCSFELVSSYAATSILCRDITLCLCRFQLFVPDVATSISCRDINSCLCSFQLVGPDVATSAHVFAAFNWWFLMSRHQLLSRHQLKELQPLNEHVLCRDINLLSRHQLTFLEASTGCFWCRDTSPLLRHHLITGKPVIAAKHFSCHDLHPLSQLQPLSRHHDAVATSFIKSLVNPQLPNL